MQDAPLNPAVFRLAASQRYASIGVFEETIQFKPDERAGVSCFGLCCCCTPMTPLKIPTARTLGASKQGAAGVQIWYVTPHSSHAQPNRRHYSLHKTRALQCQSAEEADRLVAAVRAAACSWASEDRPAKVTALVNPVSGQGRGMKDFSSTVLPVLQQAAGLQVTVVQTTHSGHATEVAAQLELGSTDMLLCVGGDGTLWEALQGLLSRPDWQRCCQLPVMQVPLGSGNGVATSCGIMDPVAAAYAAVKGRTSAMDVASVLQGDRRFYMMLLFTYGLMSNLDVGTEHLRWMGAARFTYGAIKEILVGRGYGCKVAYLPAAAAAQDDAGGAGAQAATPVTDAQPGTTTIPLPVLSSLGGTLPAVPHTTEALSAGWKLLDLPQVQLFVLANLPWIAPSYHFNPTGCLHHGYFNLIYTSTMMSRAEGLKMLMLSEEGGHVELEGVQVQGVRALLFEPLESGTSVMLDGEVVPFQPLYVEVHPGLCTVVVAPEWQRREDQL